MKKERISKYISTYNYLVAKKVIKYNNVNKSIIEPISMLLALTDYKIYILNLYYKTCGRRIICNKYNLNNVNEYKIFINKYFRKIGIDDTAESRVPILKSLNQSYKYLRNNYDARLSLLDQEISIDFINLYNYARSLKYIIMGGNDGIFNSLYINEITSYFNKLFFIINEIPANGLISSENLKLKTLKDLNMIATFYNFYESILSAIDYSKLHNEINQVSEKVIYLFQDSTNMTITDIINNMTLLIFKIYNLNPESLYQLHKEIDNCNDLLATTAFVNLESNDKPIKLINGKIAFEIKFNGIDNNDKYVDNPTIPIIDFFKENLKYVLKEINPKNSRFVLEPTNQIINKINNVKDNKSIKVKNYYIIIEKILLKTIKNKIDCNVRIINSEDYNNDDGSVVGIITLDNIDDEIRITSNEIDIKLYNDIENALLKSFINNTKLDIISIITFDLIEK